MKDSGGRFPRLVRRSLLGLALLPLFSSSCERKPKVASTPPPPPPTVTAPAPPSSLERGDQSFETGDYPKAVKEYLDYLREEPSGTQRDLALYRIGLAMALPANPSHDAGQAIVYLDQLAQEYPKSAFRPEAELIAALERDAQALHAQIEQREQELSTMNQQVEGLKEQQEAMDQLRSDLKDREDKIRQLSVELEKLKAIDLQRRPAAAPAR